MSRGGHYAAKVRRLFEVYVLVSSLTPDADVEDMYPPFASSYRCEHVSRIDRMPNSGHGQCAAYVGRVHVDRLQQAELVVVAKHLNTASSPADGTCPPAVTVTP